MPSYTAVPNAILENMHRMHPSTLAVTLFVLRQTEGYTDGNGGRKEWDRISLSQFEKATGLSRQGVIDAIAKAVSGGWIERRKKGQGYQYRCPHVAAQLVNSLDYLTITSQVSRPVDDQLVNSVDQQLVNSVDPQKKDIKKELHTDTNVSVAAQPQDLALRFRVLHEELRTAKNKPAVLRNIYTLCYGENGAPDFGYLGKVARQVGGAGYLAQRLWELTARPPNGDVLAYILQEHKHKTSRNGYANTVETVQFSEGPTW